MKYIIILITFIFLLVGCSHNHQTLSEKVNSVDARVLSLQDSLLALNHISEERIGELEKEVIYLENKIDLLDENLAFYSDRFESIYDIINLNKINSGIKTPASSTPASKKEEAKVNGTPQQLYDQARSDYVKKNLSKAQRGFTDLINKYPNHELVINSKYWLAEIDYDQVKYSDAISKFELVIGNSINPEKGIDSQYKIALINKHLGNYDIALSQARNIEKTHPNYIRINKIKAFIKELE